MNFTRIQLRFNVLVLVLALCACSHSTGMSGIYSGKNPMGETYSIEFLSSTDCIVTAGYRGKALCTYKIVDDRILFNGANGESGMFTRKGDSIVLTDEGYTVSMTKH